MRLALFFIEQQFSNVASSILGGLGGNNNNANTSNASNGEEEEESNANNNNGGFNLGGLLNDPNVRNMYVKGVLTICVGLRTS